MRHIKHLVECCATHQSPVERCATNQAEILIIRPVRQASCLHCEPIPAHPARAGLAIGDGSTALAAGGQRRSCEQASLRYGRSSLTSRTSSAHSRSHRHKEAAVSVAPGPRRRRRSNDGRVLGLSIIAFTTIVATTIVMSTGGTSGLADLATLLMIVAAVVAPPASERVRRRR